MSAKKLYKRAYQIERILKRGRNALLDGKPITMQDQMDLHREEDRIPFQLYSAAWHNLETREGTIKNSP